MRKKAPIIFFTSVVLATLSLITYLFVSHDLVILQPKGTIASDQADLLIFATLLSLVVIVPVFALTAFIGIRYREGNKKADYKPNWHHSRRLETIWWGVPILIIAVLSVVTWKTTHSLDPHKPLVSNVEPLDVQVVALQWKWLFLYPESGRASVNYLAIPEDRPINFQITSDAPMNSFWIPQLGGQIYAMSGMKTKLHLMADEPGVFDGYSANISGEGFAKMRFKTESMTAGDFATWLSSPSDTSRLSESTYSQLREPATSDVITYAQHDRTLFENIVQKYATRGDYNRKAGN